MPWSQMFIRYCRTQTREHEFAPALFSVSSLAFYITICLSSVFFYPLLCSNFYIFGINSIITLKMVQNMILHTDIVAVGWGNNFLLCFACSLFIVTRGMLQLLTVLYLLLSLILWDTRSSAPRGS